MNYGDGETQGYSFDAMGNRLGKTDTVTPLSGSPTTNTNTYTYDAANRLTDVSLDGGTATAVTFDADGNTLSDSSGRTYTWDAQNRMVSCSYEGTTTTFTYGADGLRRSMTTGGVTTNYVYDGTMLVREMQTVSGTLTPTATYLIGPDGPIARVNETSQTEGYYLPSGGSVHSRGITRWYVYDGLGSVIGEVDDNNEMTTCRQYDVYGVQRASTLQGTAATSAQGYVGSLGHMTDTSTGGLVYMQARYYDPSIGRFTNEDPGRNGENYYIYCSDNSVNEVDADGHYGKYLTALLDKIKNSDAFDLGLILSMMSYAMSLATKDSPDLMSKVAAFSMATLTAIGAVTAFAVALGGDANDAMAAALSAAVGIVGTMVRAAKVEEALDAGSDGIAGAALAASYTYGLMVTGALVLDDI